MGGLDVRAVAADDPGVGALLDRLTAELAGSGYATEEMFGYTSEQLTARGVHLVGARVDGELVGIGGVEVQDDGAAELKRFYVAPTVRGRGVADALLAALTDHAMAHGARVLRLETGDRQLAAIAFYRRAGFRHVARFGPYETSASSVCMQRDLYDLPEPE